ncbi:MAG: hypothetical protein QOI38_2639 [Sphingomonadales bacterium]|nr:hypothetical protein [Sphingomonadales bacterium]
MTLIIWIAIGAAVGFAAAFVHRLKALWPLLFNLVAGIAGAIGGGVAEGRGAIDAAPLETNALIVAACGAVILVGILNLFLRRPAP